jgi:hypothetical protein
MNSTTSIMLRSFRYALARHGREVTLTSLRAGATGRGNYIAAEGRRDNDSANYDLTVLQNSDSTAMIGSGTAKFKTIVLVCLLCDLPLVEQQRKVPCQGWIITGRFDDDTEQEEQYSITEVESAMDGQVRKLTCSRKI